MRIISWASVLYGAIVGFAAALVAFLVLGIAGLQNDLRGQSVLIFLLYVAFLLAGYMAGRSANTAHILHGGLSAMTLFALQAALTGANPIAIIFGSLVATIIGSAGGALGQWSRELDRGGSQG